MIPVRLCISGCPRAGDLLFGLLDALKSAPILTAGSATKIHVGREFKVTFISGIGSKSEYGLRAASGGRNLHCNPLSQATFPCEERQGVPMIDLLQLYWEGGQRHVLYARSPAAEDYCHFLREKLLSELTPNLPIYAACTPIAGGEIVGLVNPGAFKTMRLLTEFWDPEGIGPIYGPSPTRITSLEIRTMYTPPDPAKIAILKVHPKYKLMLRSLRTYGIIGAFDPIETLNGTQIAAMYIIMDYLALGASFQFHR